MKKYKLVVFILILTMILITGCEEESTAPQGYSNGLLITLASSDGSRDFDARNSVDCSKDLNNLVTFTCTDSDDNNWLIEFIWDSGSQNGDTVFVSDTRYNKITLDAPAGSDLDDYYITNTHSKANETYIRVLEFTDGVKIVAEIEGYIYQTGGSATPDSLKDGYLITTNF